MDDIVYTHDDESDHFQDGRPIGTLVDGLMDGQVRPLEVSFFVSGRRPMLGLDEQTVEITGTDVYNTDFGTHTCFERWPCPRNLIFRYTIMDDERFGKTIRPHIKGSHERHSRCVVVADALVCSPRGDLRVIEEDKSKSKAEWASDQERFLQLHGKETAGIPRLKLFVKGMPLRFTEAIHCEQGVFNNSKGVLQ